MKFKLFIISVLCMIFQVAFALDFKDSFSKEEKVWLASHSTIRYTGNPKYLPYEAFDNKGNHIGIVADYLNIIEKKLGIKIERIPSSSWLDAIQKTKYEQVDMLSNYTNDDEFSKTHTLTKGYIKSPVIIVKQRADYQPFISNLSELKRDRVAIGKEYAFLKPIFEKYPNLNYIKVDTIEDVLKGVASGEYDTALVTLNIATYEISEHGLRNLQIVGRTDFEMELGFQIKNEYKIFADILNKTLDSISQEEQQKISNKWTNVEIKKIIDYNLVLTILSISMLIFILLFYWNYKLKKEISKKSSEYLRLLKFFDEHVIASKTDLNGTITYASEAFCKIVGHTYSSMIGKNHRLFKHPDNDPEIYKNMWKTIKSGKNWKGLIKNRKKDDGYYWVEVTIEQDYDEFGKLVGYIAIRHDVTAEIELQNLTKDLESIVKERTEELVVINNQQKTIFDTANIGIILLQNQVIKQVNNRFCEIYGYEAHELINNSARAMYKNDEDYYEARKKCAIVETGEIATWEQKVVHKNKTVFWIRIHMKAIDAKDMSQGVVSTVEDITLEREALENIKLAKNKAEEATKTKSEFLANMSHEIRTPMNAIIGMSYLALQTNLTQQQKSYVENIENAAKNLLEIINDILDFSKIEAGKMSFENRDFSLQTILENITNLFIFKMEENGLKFSLDIDNKVPNNLNGDSLRLSQILTNLISNAIKFTSEGEIKVSIKMLAKQNDSVVLRFDVSDTGIGLSKEQIDKLFTSFHQADGSITRKYGGTGLGLSISKYLVEMMNGEIGVESELARGSNFYFTITLGLQNELNASNKQNIYTDYNNVANLVGGAKLLLVEDNVLNQEIAVELLNKIFIEVDIAQNGEEAIEKIKENDYDGILMDSQMPVMDGLKATKIIRADEQFKNIPIIALTANTMDEDIKQCIAVGMNDYISKPLDVYKFYQTILKWIKPKNKIASLDIKNSSQAGLQKLKIDGADINKALLRMGNDEKIVLNIFKRFSNSQKNAIQKIKDAFQKNDKKDAIREVHTLKSLCGNLEASYLFKELQKLENELKSQTRDNNLINNMILDIDEKLKNLIHSIDENFEVFDETSKNEDEKIIIEIDKKELSKEFSDLKKLFENLDSDAIEVTQNIAQRLAAHSSGKNLKFMLKSSLEFDFEEADKYLALLAKELEIDGF